MSGGRYKIHFFEAFFLKTCTEGLIGQVFSCLYSEEGSFQFFLGRDFFLDGFRIGNYEESFIGLFQEFADGGGALDAQGRLVIAPLYAFPGFRKEEDAVSLYHII